MPDFRRVRPEELQGNPFELIGKEWLLITGEKDGKVNSMTASWGAMGIMWGKPVAFLFIRPQRYTKEFIEAGERFSVSVLPDGNRSILNYMGTVSGRDEDKIQASGLTVTRLEDVACFAEAKINLVCKKLYAQNLVPDCFLEKELDAKWYPSHDYHTMYVAEITDAFVKD